MKKTAINIAAVLALLAGLAIGSACQGVLAFLGAFALTYGAAVTLIRVNTDWIWTR